MKYGYFLIILIPLLLVLAGCGGPGKYDAFAQCLTENGVKMFGAYWCPHCLNQKKEFGKSWQYVTYVECSLPGGQGQTEVCSKEGIKGYPTWEFANGERVSGEVPFPELSQKSGCPLPE